MSCRCCCSCDRCWCRGCCVDGTVVVSVVDVDVGSVVVVDSDVDVSEGVVDSDVDSVVGE